MSHISQKKTGKKHAFEFYLIFCVIKVTHRCLLDHTFISHETIVDFAETKERKKNATKRKRMSNENYENVNQSKASLSFLEILPAVHQWFLLRYRRFDKSRTEIQDSVANTLFFNIENWDSWNKRSRQLLQFFCFLQFSYCSFSTLIKFRKIPLALSRHWDKTTRWIFTHP